MGRTPRDASTAGRTSDGVLVGIPVFAMLLVIFPIGPIGAFAGMLLAIISLPIAYGRAPSRHRTSLMTCSVIALVGTGAVTVLQVVDWMR